MNEELLWCLKAALDWIDHIPSNIELPTMPGFDRDYVDSLIDNIERDINHDTQ